jgi:cation:H+ antiporter
LGDLTVADSLLNFSLWFYAAIVGLFYMITQDKRISGYEGIALLAIYGLFIGKTATLL